MSVNILLTECSYFSFTIKGYKSKIKLSTAPKSNSNTYLKKVIIMETTNEGIGWTGSWMNYPKQIPPYASPKFTAYAIMVMNKLISKISDSTFWMKKLQESADSEEEKEFVNQLTYVSQKPALVRIIGTNVYKNQ